MDIQQREELIPGHPGIHHERQTSCTLTSATTPRVWVQAGSASSRPRKEPTATIRTLARSSGQLGLPLPALPRSHILPAPASRGTMKPCLPATTACPTVGQKSWAESPVSPSMASTQETPGVKPAAPAPRHPQRGSLPSYRANLWCEELPKAPKTLTPALPSAAHPSLLALGMQVVAETSGGAASTGDTAPPGNGSQHPVALPSTSSLFGCCESCWCPTSHPCLIPYSSWRCYQ